VGGGDRITVGALGETIAAGFLRSHGLDVVARNIQIAKGEIDLMATDRGARVVVEVRTITSEGDPIDAVSPAKRRRVRALARAVGAARADFIGVRLGADDVLVHWVPGCG
jgi:putative endonuclease